MLRYSEIPRDISADSSIAGKISNVFNLSEDQNSSGNGDSDYGKKHNDKYETSRDKYRKISSGPGPPISYYNYGCMYSSTSLPSNIKSQSLPNHNSQSSYMLNILTITPEEFASQLTLLDLPVFMAITPDELSSCGWNKKNKLTIAPNVVAFTRRFNHVSFWTVQEVLKGTTAKQRSEILGHFIRIAKKLYDLNNLHSLFAILSALQSASIYRLSKTWNFLTKKEKQIFEKLAEVFSDSNNWQNLRAHMESLKLPCIPYLGLFLTDLVYVDMAHPHSGGLESQQRQLKMNNILRVISNYQHSDYRYLIANSKIQYYLNSVRYIEELQKFVEDDQYKLSLQLEPPSPVQSSSSCSSKESVSGNVLDPNTFASLNLSPAKLSSGSLRIQSVASSGSKFIPSHRKCRSLGTKFRSTSLPRNFHKDGLYNVGLYNPNYIAPLGIYNKSYQTVLTENGDSSKVLHLLDDSLLEDLSDSCNDQPIISIEKKKLPLQVSDKSDDDCSLLARTEEDSPSNEDQMCLLQGCLRRKTILKGGRKPTVTSWQRYWVQIWSSSLVYFSPKTFKGNSRSDFKREAYKVVSISGCTFEMGVNTVQHDMFQLIDHQRGNIYKFRAGTRANAEKWCRILNEVSTTNEQKPLPVNLMSFE